MITGKSLTALGGGGLKPEIIVTAKAGALLNLHFKDSSIILQSYQLGAEETQHTFVVDVNVTSYVIDDVTNNSYAEVLADMVAQYSVQIVYPLWLYKEGTNIASFGSRHISTIGNTKFELRDNEMYLYAYYNTGGNQAHIVVTPQNKTDITGYEKLCIRFNSYTSSGGDGAVYFGIHTSSANEDFTKHITIWPNQSETYFEVDISGSSGSYFVKVDLVTGWYGKNCVATISQIWLE